MEGLFTMFKSLILFLKQCGIEKKEDQLIISIVSNLGLEYSVCVSTFHAIRLAISNWKIPSLSTLIDSLTKEKDKLVQMGTLKISKRKYHALVVQGRNNAKSK